MVRRIHSFVEKHKIKFIILALGSSRYTIISRSAQAYSCLEDTFCAWIKKNQFSCRNATAFGFFALFIGISTFMGY